MKRVYIVRHGESEANVSGLASGPDTPLTLEGERQALVIAERFARLDVDVIIASPYRRAAETARIINDVVKKPLVHSDLFVEKRNPSEHTGVVAYDRKEVSLSRHFTEPDWRHSDEDSFTEIKARAQGALGFLLARPEENILVVSHGWFMRVLIAAQLFGETLTVEEYSRIYRYLYTRNTGLTLVEYDEKNINDGWRLITWNDHAHLG